MLAIIAEACGELLLIQHGQAPRQVVRRRNKISWQKQHFGAGKTSLHIFPTSILSSFLRDSYFYRHSLGLVSLVQPEVGNPNICVVTRKVLNCNPCLFVFHIKWFPIGCRRGCIVGADWLFLFLVKYVSYLYKHRKKVWWIALTNFLMNFVNFLFILTFLRKVWWIWLLVWRVETPWLYIGNFLVCLQNSS